MTNYPLTIGADWPQADKVSILKSVSIFFDTPPEVLTEVAGLLEEITVQPDQVIFEKGDLGSSMYIVVEGLVRVHDGEMTLNHLGERDVFGEMAALDPEPRSASVTAVQASRLFRLEAQPFHGLISRSPAIATGIIQILCQRLRERVSDMKEDYLYLQQFAKVTAAAAAVEAGVYVPEALDDVALRTDALGQLARVFQRMVREVYAREQSLKQQVAELRIEIDEVKKTQQVAEITDTDYFQRLQEKAQAFRRRSGET
jgi:CRP/FNR family transcriptional regulator, cyclic AMP receptor protein